MSDEPQIPKGVSADTPSDVNQRGIWPLWTRQQEWRQKLERKATHKALDIPDDEMNITNTKTGISTGGAIGIAAAAGIPGVAAAAILGFALLKDKSEAPKPVDPVTVNDTEYEVLFYDKDGNPISVPHISTMPKQ